MVVDFELTIEIWYQTKMRCFSTKTKNELNNLTNPQIYLINLPMIFQSIANIWQWFYLYHLGLGVSTPELFNNFFFTFKTRNMKRTTCTFRKVLYLGQYIYNRKRWCVLAHFSFQARNCSSIWSYVSWIIIINFSLQVFLIKQKKN